MKDEYGKKLRSFHLSQLHSCACSQRLNFIQNWIALQHPSHFQTLYEHSLSQVVLLKQKHAQTLLWNLAAIISHFHHRCWNESRTFYRLPNCLLILHRLNFHLGIVLRLLTIAFSLDFFDFFLFYFWTMHLPFMNYKCIVQNWTEL